MVHLVRHVKGHSLNMIILGSYLWLHYGCIKENKYESDVINADLFVANLERRLLDNVDQYR